jgi:hypothetical protein
MEKREEKSVNKREMKNEHRQRVSREKCNLQDGNRCDGKLDFQKIKVVIVSTSNRNPYNPFSHMSAEDSLQGIVDMCAQIWFRANS